MLAALSVRTVIRGMVIQLASRTCVTPDSETCKLACLSKPILSEPRLAQVVPHHVIDKA